MVLGGLNKTSIDQRRVLVVNDGAKIAAQLRDQFPNWDIRESGGFLPAIGLLASERLATVFAYVDSTQRDASHAVAGLRDAAGPDATIIVCCHADGETLAMDALNNGADAYLLCPLQRDKIDAAMRPRGANDGRNTPAHTINTARAVNTTDAADTVNASTDELVALGDVVANLDAGEDDFLKSLVALVRAAFDTKQAGVVINDVAATSGTGGVAEPVMTEPVASNDDITGHVSIGPPDGGDYDDTDRDKLRHYARLIGQLASAAADRRRYRDLAYTDELSGLPNRRYLLRFLKELLAKAAKDGSTVTMLMFDIDYFKRYNDQYGHDAGDEIIRDCGQLFRRNCRDHDVVTRYGGDEFAVVFWDKDGTREPGSQHPSNVLPIIERCRRSLQTLQFESFNVPEGSRLTISGGLASFPEDADTVESLITRADEALLRAKRDGKNRIFIGGENGGAALTEQKPLDRDVSD
jgi:diguanylate cyclase (GGDEF)-like protein